MFQHPCGSPNWLLQRMRYHMARTPKAPPPPAPARRGRKLRQAELTAATNDGGADAGATASEAAPVTPNGAPPHGKLGRRSKQQPAPAMPVLPDGDAEQPGMDPGQPQATFKQAPAQDNGGSAGVAGLVNADEGQFISSSDAGLGKGPPTANQGSSGQPQPAARWDKAAGVAQFDWPAIERTAAQDGPNQVMAKLLLAARAEGANSRWPLS